MNLAEKISKNHQKIKKFLHYGYVNWDDLINRIDRQLKNETLDFADEQVWTFLIACGYAIAAENGLKKLSSILTKSENYITNKIYIEVLPISPREKEGQTHLDLAIGSIEIRQGTESGIELIPENKPWVCFCEMKWYSDISYNVSYDQHRNQLSRVIENALTFQKNKKFSDKIFVNLVTPKAFMDQKNKSRLYCYKFQEYNSSNEKLIQDINNSKLRKKDNNQNWKKPELNDEISKLSLNWISYEELFCSIPKSVISKEIKEFESKYNKSKK